MKNLIPIGKLFLKGKLLDLFIEYQQSLSDYLSDRITKEEYLKFDISGKLDDILNIKKENEPTR